MEIRAENEAVEFSNSPKSNSIVQVELLRIAQRRLISLILKSLQESIVSSKSAGDEMLLQADVVVLSHRWQISAILLTYLGQLQQYTSDGDPRRMANVQDATFCVSCLPNPMPILHKNL
jgi:hypothetical protein